MQQTAEHGDHVTTDQFKAGVAELRADIATQINGLTWRIIGIGGVAVAVLRWLE